MNIPVVVTNVQQNVLKRDIDTLFETLKSTEDLQETLDGFIPKSASCNTLHDITKYIPLWVVYEKQELESQGQTPISIFDFLQKYYDWLYCDTDEGAQYTLSEKLLDLIDVETTKSKFYESFAFAYANGFNTSILDINGGNVSTENFIKFIKSIRKNLHQRKTTISAIRYFFVSLFGIENPADVEIYEPKRNMLRLNGGAFLSDKFKFRNEGTTGDYNDRYDLAGSYLNGSRMQDSDWIQEYSYLLKIGKTADIYREMYLDMLHPAGMRVVFEKTINDYEGPQNPDITQTLSESPLIGNYGPYQIGVTYNSGISYIGGITLYGLPQCTGCTTGYGWDDGATYGVVTHFFPNWTNEITESNFLFINIGDLFDIYYQEGFTSPNSGLTCGACPAWP